MLVLPVSMFVTWAVRTGTIGVSELALAQPASQTGDGCDDRQ